MSRRLFSALLICAVASALVATTERGPLASGDGQQLGGLTIAALAHVARPDAPTVRQAGSRTVPPAALPPGLLPSAKTDVVPGTWQRLACASPDFGRPATLLFPTRSTRGPPGRDSFLIES